MVRPGLAAMELPKDKAWNFESMEWSYSETYVNRFVYEKQAVN